VRASKIGIKVFMKNILNITIYFMVYIISLLAKDKDEDTLYSVLYINYSGYSQHIHMCMGYRLSLLSVQFYQSPDLKSFLRVYAVFIGITLNFL